MQTSTAPVSIRSRQPPGENSLWPAQTGMRPAMAHLAHVAAVIGPDARLLEPADVEVRNPGGRGRVPAETVYPWLASIVRTKSSPACLARRPDGARHPPPGTAPPILNLHPGSPEGSRHSATSSRDGPQDRARNNRRWMLTGTDARGNHPTIATGAAPEPSRTASQIAEIDAGQGATRPIRRSRSLVEGGGKTELPAARVREGILADQLAARSPRGSPEQCRRASCLRRRHRPRRSCPLRCQPGDHAGAIRPSGSSSRGRRHASGTTIGTSEISRILRERVRSMPTGSGPSVGFVSSTAASIVNRLSHSQSASDELPSLAFCRPEQPSFGSSAATRRG